MTNTTFRGIQIGRVQILVGLEPRPRRQRRLTGNWLHPEDRFLGYDGYAGGEPQPKDDGGVE
jgi:hypothetical protein